VVALVSGALVADPLPSRVASSAFGRAVSMTQVIQMISMLEPSQMLTIRLLCYFSVILLIIFGLGTFYFTAVGHYFLCIFFPIHISLFVRVIKLYYRF